MLLPREAASETWQQPRAINCVSSLIAIRVVSASTKKSQAAQATWLHHYLAKDAVALFLFGDLALQVPVKKLDLFAILGYDIHAL